MPHSPDCARPAPEAVGPEADRWAQLALDLARMGTWSLDLATDAFESDVRERELLGFAPDEAITGEAVFARIHPDDVGLLGGAIAASVAAHGTYDAEFRVRLPDGTVRQLVTRGRVECGAAGTPVRLAGVTYDATAAREAERALRAIETTVDGIITIDDRGRILVNRIEGNGSRAAVRSHVINDRGQVLGQRDDFYGVLWETRGRG